MLFVNSAGLAVRSCIMNCVIGLGRVYGEQGCLKLKFKSLALKRAERPALSEAEERHPCGNKVSVREGDSPVRQRRMSLWRTRRTGGAPGDAPGDGEPGFGRSLSARGAPVPGGPAERRTRLGAGLWLQGANLRCITTDGNPGLIGAVEIVYPAVARQRCWVHKMRNVANKLKKDLREEAHAGRVRIYSAKNRRQALLAFEEWYSKWHTIDAQAADCLKRDLEELLTIFALPSEHRLLMRTTNPLERAFVEVRRRSRPMSLVLFFIFRNVFLECGSLAPAL